ncbi:Cystathionine beta-lyase [Raoultella terrigena]|uniref:Cystathionine beta-lyase n=1 Tax=Raoultella terrigena TaxID=577 RepID=A0A3P8IR42_RAOTE|nr:Cystathionine beta-lyase [Raoultella terrigena]
MKNLNTLSVHGGTFSDAHGAVMPPIYATSTFAQPAPGQHTGYEYSRSGNPTRHALETAIAELESGSRGYAFASGLAAISTVLELLDKDSHLVAVDDVYGGTWRLIENVRRRSAGLRVSWVKPDDPAAIEAAIRPDTRMIWVETPTNPLLKLADLSAIAAIARRHNLISVTDNTFASRPFIVPSSWALISSCTRRQNISTAIPTWWRASRWSATTAIWRSGWGICKTRWAACSTPSAAF